MNKSYQQNQNQGTIYNADQITINNNPVPPLPLSSIPQNSRPSGTNTFVGRSQELQQIADFFEKSSQLAVTSAVKSVTGMGGIGKTELAVQYALRYQENYQGGICWVNARIDIAIQIISFCSSIKINPPDYCDTIEKKIDFCWNHWIEGKVLLIFDDVQNYQAIKPYLPPKNDKFKLIVTSWQRLGQLSQLELTVLSPENAIALLKQIIGENRVNQELAKANELCKWLGYLPLGLELVARFLKVYETKSLEQVLQELNEKKLQARALLDPNLDDKDMTAQLGVASAFELSWEKLSQKGQQLGCYLSLFKGESFDWDWVELLYKPSPQNLSKKILNFLTFKTSETITVEELETLRQEELRKFALLQMINEEGQLKPLYICHPLVSLFFESKLNELTTATEFKQTFCQIMANLATSIDSQPTKQKIEEFTIIAPHLITVATEMIDYAEDNYLIWYFVSLGDFYEGQTVYEEAIKWLKEGLTILKKRLGDENKSVSLCINNLAELYQSQGKYEQAESLLLQALDMNKKLLGSEHPDVALSINNLAALYESQGKYQQAEPLSLSSLEMFKKLLGEEHPDVASSINNLAGLYVRQGKYEQAEPLFLQALEMRKKLLGDEHPYVATSINNLALLYYSQGKYEQAEPLFLQALEMFKKLLGEEHPSVALSINNLAELYQSQGKYEQAEPLYFKSLEMKKKLLGDEHPDVALSINNLALLYYSQGKYEQAEPLYFKSLEMSKKLLGEEHPYVALSINNLALLYYSQGKYEEAEPLFLQALEMRKKLLGDEHPDVATSINNLAGLYYSQGKYEQAEPLYLQALSILFSSLGKNHPNTITGYNNFGYFLQEVIKENRVKELSDHPFTQSLLKELSP